MKHPRLIVLLWLFGSLALASACDSSDSDSCTRYKDALALQAECDPDSATLLVDGSFDAYRCVTQEEFEERGALESLAACTDYLESIINDDGECMVPNGENDGLCKRHLLVLLEGDGEVAATDSIGNACSIRSVPSGGFLAEESYLLSQGSQCASGVCLAHGLEGDPSVDCDPATSTCLSAADIAEHVYCSYLCDASWEDAEIWACPEGFSCETDLSPLGGNGLRSGYCVRP